MALWKSTKIGLTFAGVALAGQLALGLVAEAPAQAPVNETASTTMTLQTVETAESQALKECMNTRTGRSTEERGSVDRSATERKTRWEIYAEREANCKASLNAAATAEQYVENINNNEASATAATTTAEETITIGGGTPYTGYKQATVPKASL